MHPNLLSERYESVPYANLPAAFPRSFFKSLCFQSSHSFMHIFLYRDRFSLSDYSLGSYGTNYYMTTIF